MAKKFNRHTIDLLVPISKGPLTLTINQEVIAVSSLLDLGILLIDVHQIKD